MKYRVEESQCKSLAYGTAREWLLTNGIGGYASGTLSGINTRRYHGLLIAATNPPAERTLLLSSMEASITADGPPIWISANQYPGTIFPEGYQFIDAFSAEQNRVDWVYRAGKIKVQKTIKMARYANAISLCYENLSEKTIQLALRPLMAHRSHHGNFFESPAYPHALAFPRECTVVEHEGVELRLIHRNALRYPVQGWYYRFEHIREAERGLDPRDDLFCPCELQYMLAPGEKAEVIASADGDEEFEFDAPQLLGATSDLKSSLMEAAEKFLVETENRTSIIAGYPWFTDWGRDTMISLPGICLIPGKIDTAQSILRDYASQLNQGLIPNRFVEEDSHPEYNTVDGTLWFINAVYQTLQTKWDEEFAQEMMAVCEEIFAQHVKGTHFGIRVDSTDGLLTQGAPGEQLTWMDAKIEEWIVTPRHGKPVEIQGLWIHGLRVMDWLASELGRSGEKFRKAAEKAEKSFEQKFWCESRGHYFDTVDPYDASLRPNQVIAMALEFGPAKGERAVQALRVVQRELLTEMGLRTLGPEEPGYKGKFVGPLRELDAAYHQGTVWPWLLGPYASAVVRLTGDRQEAKHALKAAKYMLSETGLGGIAEVYDGDVPQAAGGCPWQAWSVAEILRAWVQDVGE